MVVARIGASSARPWPVAMTVSVVSSPMGDPERGLVGAEQRVAIR